MFPCFLGEVVVVTVLDASDGPRAEHRMCRATVQKATHRWSSFKSPQDDRARRCSSSCLRPSDAPSIMFSCSSCLLKSATRSQTNEGLPQVSVRVVGTTSALPSGVRHARGGAKEIPNGHMGTRSAMGVFACRQTGQTGTLRVWFGSASCFFANAADVLVPKTELRRPGSDRSPQTAEPIHSVKLRVAS